MRFLKFPIATRFAIFEQAIDVSYVDGWGDINSVEISLI